jgi:nucleotide-binding universal stress UspA family protein
MIERILLADSGTGHSEEMLKALMSIPSMQRAMVTVLHVVAPQVSAMGMEAQWKKGEALVQSAVDRLGLDAANVTTVLRSGDPKDIVCQVAEETNTDLIIMGSRGLKSRLWSIIENSVSQYVFQLSPRPMLMVQDDLYVRPIQRVTVAMDKSDPAQKCLELAMFLLRDLPGSKLNLVRIDANAKSDVSGSAAEQDAVLMPAIAMAKRYGIEYRAFVGTGETGATICRIAEEARTDLLLLGSPDRRPKIGKTLPDIDRLLGSSLSDYVRTHATCPVLMTRTVG